MNHFSSYRNEGRGARSEGESVSSEYIRKSVDLVAAMAELCLWPGPDVLQDVLGGWQRQQQGSTGLERPMCNGISDKRTIWIMSESL